MWQDFSMNKIGLFGGTFNPVPCAHRELALCAIETLSLDRLFWIPCKPWQKAGQAIESGEHRTAMIDRVIAGDSRMAIDPCELNRVGDTYTIDTIKDFQNRYPDSEIVFLMGSDQWANFHTWKAWETVLKTVRLVIVTRNGEKSTPSEAVRAFMEKEQIDVTFLEMPAMAVSSQEIRDIIAKDGPLFDKLAGKLPRDVIEYIATLGLYQH